MIARLTPENEEFIRLQIESGTFPDRESVFNAGLALLRERTDLIARLKVGRQQLDDGEFVDHDESSLNRLFGGLRQRAGVADHDEPSGT